MEKIQEFRDGFLWKVEEGETITIGVTQSALDQIGAVQAIDLADTGDEFEQGDWIGEVRGKDSLIELVAPCKLRIAEQNRELIEQPGVLEDDPTGDAWMLRAERIG